MSTTLNPVAEATEMIESHLHPVASWDLDDHPMPSGGEEIWRFTPLRLADPLLNAQPDAQSLRWQGELPAGVTMTQVNRERARALVVEPPVDRVAALAVQDAEQATHIDIPAGTELDEPLMLDAITTGPTAQHCVITIGAQSRLVIVLRYSGTGQLAEKLDVIVGDGAQVDFITIQDWADETLHGGQRSILIGRDAQVRAITASLGGAVVRLQENSRYAGPGGNLQQLGLYFVEGGQHIQHRLFVDHNAPHTTSNVDYRGALQGKGAHSVWIGDVLIRKAAEQIQTYESNKNLVLTDGCRADSVPNLEIETGEILGAGHSSTTGRFDDEQVFYLRSRGISEEEARKLIVRGFFVEIVRTIGVPEIEERLMVAVEHELALATKLIAAEH